jgi:two-component system, response regulator
MLHLLLVEDNSADVLLFREGLRRCDIPADVLIAHDGEQAMRLLNDLSFRPDFIVLDLNLPKCSGMELLERFRDTAGSPVIVLTSSTNPDDQDRAMALGALEYVIKPVGFGPFTSAVGGILERWAGTQGAIGA